MVFFGVFEYLNVVNIFRALCLLISTSCYRLIIYFYDIFIRLGHAQILTSGQVEKVYSRVTLILGIFMLFKLMFSFVQYVLNPELMSDKSKGASKIVTKAVVVVALLGTTPFIFEQAYKLQDLILDSNILGKVIFATDGESEVQDFGAELASGLFFSFYSVNEGESCPELGDNYSEMKAEIKALHKFDLAYECLAEKGDNYDYVINYEGHGILSVAVSAFVLYIILSYCLSVGVRVIKLAFLQLIAPIPIISYLGEDKDGAFGKWVKRCVSTFIELFIRLAIIYFVVYVISFLLDTESDSYYLLLSTTGDPTGFLKKLILVIIIIGLLLFAKKAPELLKEVLPQGMGNDYGFNFAKDLKTARETAAPVGRGLGFIGGSAIGSGVSAVARFNANRRAGKNLGKSLLGAAGGAAAGWVTGGMNGMKKGNMFKNVASGVKAVRTADNKYNNLINSDGSVIGKFVSKATDIVGETRGQRYTRIINNSKAIGDLRDKAYDAIEKTTGVSAAKNALHDITQKPGESDSQFQNRRKRMSNTYDNHADAAFNAAVDGENSYRWEAEKAIDLNSIKSTADKKLSFDFSQLNAVSGNAGDTFDLRLRTFEQQLDNQIKSFEISGGDVSNIDKKAILDSFAVHLGSDNSNSFEYSLPIGTDEDRKTVAKMVLRQNIEEQVRNYVKSGAGLKEKAKAEDIDVDKIMQDFESYWAANDGQGEFEYKIYEAESFEGSDDRRIATVLSNCSQAKSIAKATNAVYYDRKDNEWKKYEFDSGEDFRSAGKKRDNTVSAITSQEDYQRALANDKAAGVDSNASSNK